MSTADEADVLATLREYIRAFETGTRDDAQAFCHLPIAYVTDTQVQLRERYPFDPVKLRQVTGLVRSDVTLKVLHMDETRAHVVIEGERLRADGSVIEGIQALYILHRLRDVWRITLISGLRTPR